MKEPNFQRWQRNCDPSLGDVAKLPGGVISAKTMANLDSLGEGPKRMRIGGKVAYLTEDLLEWLDNRTMELA